MLKEESTLLLMTCDKYSSAWYPFFTLLDRYWPQHPKNVVLCTESKSYTHEGFEIQCFNSSAQWSDRLRAALDSIKTEYIIFALEDFFLQGPVKQNVIDSSFNYLIKHDDIAQIRFKNCDNTDQARALKKEVFKDFYEAGNNVIYRIDTQIAVWRKNALMDLIINNEDPWQFETRGTERAKKMDWRYVWYKYSGNPDDTLSLVIPYQLLHQYGYGITGGHWLWNNRKLFEENGIEVDLSELGVSTKLSYQYANFFRKAIYQKDARILHRIFRVGYRIVNKIKRIAVNDDRARKGKK